ncbi:hypothetical protein ACKI10_06875 [Streptomyces galilaeus]|uniref:hypothetical protein n=1 Tax=Streptomyces galilaeus TaxID=33899 RepID=UPI0038F71D63
MKNPTYRAEPRWARQGIRRAVGRPEILRGIAWAQQTDGCVLLQLVWQPQRGNVVAVQYPVPDVADAYDKAAADMPPGEHVAYYVVATVESLRRAEVNGVAYVRAWGDDGGSILSVPVSLWTDRD